MAFPPQPSLVFRDRCGSSARFSCLAQIGLVAGGRHEIAQHDADGKRLVPRDLAPELVEAGEQEADVADRMEADLVPKAAGSPIHDRRRPGRQQWWSPRRSRSAV
jgi:hypothetical protein